MREANGDLFQLAKGSVLVITTNGSRKALGGAIMGRGCAKQAADIWPDFPRLLGDALEQHGNSVNCFPVLGDPEYEAVVTFPVKDKWWESARLSLIDKSAEELVKLADQEGWKHVFVPRPGCGAGKLDWSNVRPILQSRFDDRFIIVDF